MVPLESAYRKTTAVGATGIALLIALFDALAGDLRRAADAERAGKLEKRCAELNHAIMVIGYLEDRVRRGSGGALAEQLTLLYRSLRHNILQAQARRSPEILGQALAEVLKVREAWQEVALRPGSMAAAGPVPDAGYPGAACQGEAHGSSSWLA